ncbi:MAG: hypothetical protein SV760_08190 [Halobacteria archaeon]|nr:hypothetical protein [Halobacteria archaeon]
MFQVREHPLMAGCPSCGIDWDIKKRLLVSSKKRVGYRKVDRRYAVCKNCGEVSSLPEFDSSEYRNSLSIR